jgi:uncharacterized damage-inducible protein DinB
MTADEARQHLRYSTWASRRLLNDALALDAELLHRDLGVPNKSIHGTLAHILMADRNWLARVLGAPVEPSEAIEVEWPRIHQGWEEWSNALTDADLARVVAYQDLKGNPHETPLWQIVMHVVNHATLHRGQVMAMFRQVGAAPPPTDLIFYYREQRAHKTA